MTTSTPASASLAPDPLPRLEDLSVRVERQDRDLQGGDGDRPRRALVVVVLLDDGRERAGDADAVAAHEEGPLLAGLVRERGAHRVGVLRAELEDLAHLDAARTLERAAAHRAAVTGAATTRSAQRATSKSRPGRAPSRW